MKAILFIDLTCTIPYDPNILDSYPMGGTEATVIRIAEELSKSYKVIVAQHNRTKPSLVGALYTGLDSLPENVDYVVSIRNSKILPFNLKIWSKARHFLWAHDLPSNHYVSDFNFMAEHGVEVIAVSNWHKSSMVDFLGQLRLQGQCPKINVLYNPIHPIEKHQSFDKNKLVFFSSPHKGLKETIALFSFLNKKYPALKLYYSNPGYYQSVDIKHPNIINKGEMTHKQIMDFIKDAMCVFYPNYVYPETFGLVFAEANELGIPVLSCAIGAADEVLGAGQTSRSEEELIAKFDAWYAGKRPEVTGNSKFYIDNVGKGWISLLEGSTDTVEIEQDDTWHDISFL